MRERLIKLARGIDAGLFAGGVAFVARWGWPSTFWGWSWLLSAVLPFVSWVAWHSIKGRIETRRVRQTMAYRREKFGGFVTLPRAKDGRRVVAPVERQDGQ